MISQPQLNNWLLFTDVAESNNGNWKRSSLISQLQGSPSISAFTDTNEQAGVE